MPVASSAQNKRAILKLSSNKEHKPSKPQNLTTIELRIRENHSPTMVDNIINDRTLTKKLINGAWTLFCTVCKTVITAQVLTLKGINIDSKYIMRLIRVTGRLTT